MTQLISAFPCLGKTTLYELNKAHTFDRECSPSPKCGFCICDNAIQPYDQYTWGKGKSMHSPRLLLR